MFIPALKHVWLFFVPGGILLAAATILARFAAPPDDLRAFLPLLPYLVCAGGLLLGWRFNRSRLVFAVLALVLSHHALSVAEDGAGERLVAAAVSLLLPLNLGVISLYREKGIFTRSGMLKTSLILFPPVLIAWHHARHPGVLLARLEEPLLAAGTLATLPPLQPALAAVGLVLLIMLGRFLRRPQPLEGGFLWALGALLPVLLTDPDATARAFYFATSGLILVTSIIEASHGMAFRDELTGLPARRALNETLQKMGSRYAVAMVDIDYFKKVNDRHGHDVGDQVLKMVAAKLARVSGGGKAFRYGGEEFTILFPGKRAEEAREHLERLREAVAGSGFTLRHAARPRKKPEGRVSKKGDRQLEITVSIGLAERGAHLSRPAQVIKAADRALYKAKKGGRNRVCGEGG